MLKQSTIDFLKEIKRNNNKAWFDANRPWFDEAKEDFEKLVSELIERLGKVDSEIAPLEAKHCTFRQYRDVRFSKDKTPYKIHMGASLDRGGKKSGFAGYYFHCEPGNASLVGGGLWMPPADALKKVRQEIDYCWDEFKSIIKAKDFRARYADLERGEFALSREPKGYEKDNQAIEYLKLKSVVAIHELSDEELTSKTLADKIIKSFTALMPLIKFINRSLE
jgi:uncharacterized protein (TIGR02453 family)